MPPIFAGILSGRAEKVGVAESGEGAKNRRVESLGKTLVPIGVAIALSGAVLWWSGRNGGGFLPGDIVVEKRNVRCYFPIVTSVVVSLILTLLLWLWRR